MASSGMRFVVEKDSVKEKHKKRSVSMKEVELKKVDRYANISIRFVDCDRA